MNFALINPKVWLELALAAALIGCGWSAYNWVYDRGVDSIQRKWDAAKLQEAKESAKVLAEAASTTKNLAATIEAQRSDTNAQITTLNATVARAVTGLSNRPARDSAGGVPRDPTTGAALGATGADLLRPDAEFLIRETARADKLRLQLAQCQAQYTKVFNALNGIKE